MSSKFFLVYMYFKMGRVWGGGRVAVVPGKLGCFHRSIISLHERGPSVLMAVHKNKNTYHVTMQTHSRSRRVGPVEPGTKYE